MGAEHFTPGLTEKIWAYITLQEMQEKYCLPSWQVYWKNNSGVCSLASQSTEESGNVGWSRCFPSEEDHSTHLPCLPAGPCDARFSPSRLWHSVVHVMLPNYFWNEFCTEASGLWVKTFMVQARPPGHSSCRFRIITLALVRMPSLLSCPT